MEQTEATCGTCKYFAVYDHLQDEGQCHRYPPLIAGDRPAQLMSKFPEVHAGNWCGEFRPRQPVNVIAKG